MDYHIDSKILKTTKEVTLWKSDKAIVRIGDKALAARVMVDEEPYGYVLWGDGTLLLDTIVETERGAIGESVEREVTKPFAMIGQLPSIQENLEDAEEGDSAQREGDNRSDLLEKADRLVGKLLDKSSRDPVKKGGLLFAFPNEEDELDLLIVKGRKLVYKSTDQVFVAKGDNVVLTRRHGEVVISKPGRSVVVSKRRSPHIHISHSQDEWR
jgi:hypothetical protein